MNGLENPSHNIRNKMINIKCLEELDLENISEIKNAGQKVVYKASSEEYGDVAVKIIKQSQNLDRILVST